MHYSNRASIMTGQYASRQGVIDNVARDAMSHRLPNYHLELQRLGYATAHIGKWHVATSLSARTSRPPSSTRGRETRIQGRSLLPCFPGDPGRVPGENRSRSNAGPSRPCPGWSAWPTRRLLLETIGL